MILPIESAFPTTHIAIKCRLRDDDPSIDETWWDETIVCFAMIRDEDEELEIVPVVLSDLGTQWDGTFTLRDTDIVWRKKGE